MDTVVEYKSTPCPSCGHLYSRIRVTKIEGAFRRRYHTCTACRDNYQSVEPMTGPPKPGDTLTR